MAEINADSEIMYLDHIPGGAHWSLIMRRGTTLKVTDLEGGANVSMLFYNPQDKLERYNAPDTLKCQHTFKLTQGHCLYSDMGRIFCSITADTLGWHDTVGGHLSKQKLAAKYNVKSYQQAGNDWTLSSEHCFFVELAKYGLSKTDLAANLNLFSKVFPGHDGNLHFETEHSKAGDRIDLRFEMDTLVIFNTCPHPMNPLKDYPRKPIEYQICKSAPISDDDECMNSCDENQRGFQNNALYHLTGGY
ncbi:MAG: urea carboxylase-associated family protein [Acidiferrobacterales bacterium]|nr:urea carboxylase-associated family protein [Acidiferrobacterales bacterium]